jgi:hypothetical protein
VKSLITLLIFSSLSYANGLFEFTYGTASGDFYVQDIDTEADDIISAEMNKFGFNFEHFFTSNQKYILSFISRSISYSNADAEFLDNDLNESDIKLAWAYASGNFQIDLGINQITFYTFEVINGNEVKFTSDSAKAPYLNFQYVFNVYNDWFLGAEAFYIPETSSDKGDKINTTTLKANIIKQFGGVRLGFYYLTRDQDITTDELLIRRDATGLGLDLIFLF